MKTAYIFHDAFSDPNSDWYPWLKTTLEEQGYLVTVPKFPTPGGQSYDSWKAVMKSYTDKFDSETIFIGHGVGGTFALRILEEISMQIHGLFLVASYAEPLGHVGYDRVNETFVNHTFDWEKIKNKAHTIKLFAGQNDPFVPTVLTEKLATSLGVSVMIIPDGGHINKAAGFTQCIPLAQGIKEGLGEIEKSIVIDSSVSLDDSRASSSWQEEQPAPATLESSSPSYQEGDAEGRGSLAMPLGEKKFAAEALMGSHTMYQDMTKLINSNEGKVATSLLGKARADEDAKKVDAPLTPTNSIYIAGTFAVILVIIGIGVLVVTRYLPAQRNNPSHTVPSLIQSEFHKNIAVSSKQPYEVAQAIATTLTQPPQSGALVDIYYTRGNLRASFVDVLDSLDLANDVPPSLTGEFVPAGITDTPVFMHGLASLNGKSAHVLILPITHYDRAFAGFRDWEPTLFRDLGIFMNISPATLKTQTNNATFHDEMIANKNIRVESNRLIAYFFLNEHTVIVVDNLDLIPELLTRYANSQIYK